MSRILGGAVGTPVAQEGSHTTSCDYNPADANAIAPYAQVQIDWDAGEDAMTGTRIAEKVMGRDAGFSVSEPIEGLGDEASAMMGGVTNVRKGQAFIQIALGMQTNAKEKGIAIAKTLLARAGDVMGAK